MGEPGPGHGSDGPRKLTQRKAVPVHQPARDTEKALAPARANSAPGQFDALTLHHPLNCIDDVALPFGVHSVLSNRFWMLPGSKSCHGSWGCAHSAAGLRANPDAPKAQTGGRHCVVLGKAPAIGGACGRR